MEPTILGSFKTSTKHLLNACLKNVIIRRLFKMQHQNEPSCCENV
uniref:Uncharacterized protein n=1 Tax=Anguilla anguilla TaxID=7936 RepID=A0A0E9PT76_ANGAN